MGWKIKISSTNPTTRDILSIMNDDNEFKHKDSYGAVHQSYKYEFRIVAVTVSQKVEELTIKHIAEKQKCEKTLSNL